MWSLTILPLIVLVLLLVIWSEAIRIMEECGQKACQKPVRNSKSLLTNLYVGSDVMFYIQRRRFQGDARGASFPHFMLKWKIKGLNVRNCSSSHLPPYLCKKRTLLTPPPLPISHFKRGCLMLWFSVCFIYKSVSCLFCFILHRIDTLLYFLCYPQVPLVKTKVIYFLCILMKTSISMPFHSGERVTSEGSPLLWRGSCLLHVRYLSRKLRVGTGAK